jgi:hypothetical protein
VASLHRHRYRDGGLLPRCIANRTQVQACFSTAANQAPRSTTSSPTLRRNRRTGVNYGIVCYYGPVFTNLDLCRHVSSNASLRLTKRAQQRSGEVCLASAHTKPPRVTLGWYCLPFLSVIYDSRYSDLLDLHSLHYFCISIAGAGLCFPPNISQ